MASLNHVVLIGRLTRDPELRYTAAGLAVTSFSLAVDRRTKNEQGERQTDFFRCTAWRQTAEFVQQYIQKGRLVAVEGSVEINEYNDRDGARRTSVDVQCQSVTTLDAPREQTDGPVDSYPADDTYQQPPAQAQQAAPQQAQPQQAQRALGRAGLQEAQRSAPQAQAPQGARPAQRSMQSPPQGAQARQAPQQAPQAAPPVADDWIDEDPFAD